MMRARTIREGSVGLLILFGIGLLGFLILWLRGLELGQRTYRFFVEFAATEGMQTGAPVLYRGVPVGEVVAIRPAANGVEVEVEVAQPDLLIPKNVIVEANQSGFLAETFIDITPQAQLSASVMETRPWAEDCNSALVVCSGDRLQGEVGVSFKELIRSTVELSSQFTDPELFANVQELTKNSADAAAEVSQLTREVTTLVRLVRQEVGPLSDSAVTVADSVSRAADQLGATASQTNELLTANRAALVTTLDNLSVTSGQLRTIVDSFAPLAERGEITRNLELLSANAAAASTNLRTLTTQWNDPTTAVMLQQTLDSARATFQNLQKITADVDDLTGDPELRQNLRELINGFSSLVSTTQQLEQQTQIAQTLAAPDSPQPSGIPASEREAMDQVAQPDAEITWAIADRSSFHPSDQQPTSRPFTVRSRIGERVQIAFPIVRPAEGEQQESSKE